MVSKHRRPNDGCTGDRRTGNRNTVDLTAQVSRGDGAEPIDCVVHNTCLTGCMIVSEEIEKLDGSSIHLQISGFPDPVAGRVVWRDGKSAGVRLI